MENDGPLEFRRTVGARVLVLDALIASGQCDMDVAASLRTKLLSLPQHAEYVSDGETVMAVYRKG